MLEQSYQLIRTALSFFYPAYCVSCRKNRTYFSPKTDLQSQIQEGFCSICQKKLFRNDTHNCQICDAPLVVGSKKEKTCWQCKKSRPMYRQAQSMFVYEGSIRKAIHRFKYEQDLVAGRVLQECFSHSIELLSLPWHEYDFATSVPLHPKRLRERGYQQSWLLLRALDLPKNIEKHPSLLCKTEQTEHQARLDREQRIHNLNKSIQINKKYQNSLKNKRILLIDDILTTGTTANSCAQEMLDAKAKSVDVLTLCRAV